MRKEAGGASPKSSGKTDYLLYAVVVLNVALLFCAVLLYGRYASVYQERLREENLGNIKNLNQSAAGNVTALVSSWDIKLDDIARYANRHALTQESLLSLLDDMNSAEGRHFELIGGDYTGYLARREADGAFIPLSYQGDSYRALQQVFDDVRDEAYADICFAPEFTDGVTALKYFAIYRHLSLTNEAGAEEPYTLLLAAKSSDVLAAFNMQSGFEGQSTVLMDAAGNYIVSNANFKSANFYQYLYVYNDLSLDARNEIERMMQQNGEGELYYKNAAGQDCVFCYARMTTNDWYCVTCVPLMSFRTPAFSISYAVYAALALLVMLAADVLWLRHMNSRLRVSMAHEKEAGDAKTDFLSRMSHDIRTPLNGIIGLTALAVDERDPKRMREYLENIRLSGDFLLGLVNDVLDMSKVESGKIELHPEPYRCEEFCRYVDAVIAPLCREKGQELVVTPSDDTNPVMLDRLRFNQIFFNLLSNAVKFTPKGGRIELFWTATPLPEGRMALDFTVRDNGVGMSETFQKHMYEAFSQENAGAANAGTGLGLSIAHNLVKLMGGSIQVESKQGVGTAFKVHLVTAVCRREEKALPVVKGKALTGKRVLLCEDNAINTMVAERLLEKWGILTDAAGNGKIGYDLYCAAAPGTYHAVLMDVMMPVMDGFAATRAIRQSGRADAETIPVIAMTANAYDTDAKACLDAGMNAHIGKPVDAERLHALLEELL